jgi:cell division protein FtsQ
MRLSRRLIVMAIAIAASLAAGTGVRIAFGGDGGSLRARLEGWAQRIGLGLDQVVLIGHRYTPDTDIFEAIDLKRSRTMLTFDSQRAQSRIAELPWILAASIERVFPDRLEVRVTERTPVAVFSRGEKAVLIDATGRTLAPVAADTLPGLPRVSGEGAEGAAAGLLALLAANPELTSRVAYAERVGGRRWTLRLKSGGAVQLPAEGEAAAFSQAAMILAVAGSDRAEIDLRAPQRAILRELPRASQAQLVRPERRPTDRL